jgi:hypothetical protein
MEFEALSPNERAARYRKKATEQMELAGSSDTPAIRAGCLELAAMWMRLAEAAEQGGVAAEARRVRADDLDKRAKA